MDTFLKILLYIWQLPQNIVGLLVVSHLWPVPNVRFRGEMICYSDRMRGGISLGRYIILARHYWDDEDGDTELHEYGHALQSRYLGPFYLIVIGLPSILWAWWWNEGRNRDYYSFYTERWADILGGVKRDE